MMGLSHAEPFSLSRRSMLKLLFGAGAWAVWGDVAAGGKTMSILKRAIPRSGERLPAVGLGTARTFDVGPDPNVRAPLKEVLKLFVERGGSVVDSSPMYGKAETVVGDLAAELGVHKSLFLATKVVTHGRKGGVRQMETSMRRMHSPRIDLIQVHNLVDWRTQLDNLRAWKEAGRIRYLGVTHWRLGAFGRIEQIVKTEKLDFIEIPYSIVTRKAEERLLPAAVEHGTAMIAHTPFEVGDLFRGVRGKSLPSWAAEFDCQSWAQFFLKFILSHPAVTCVIPATTKAKHLVDNMQAGYGRLPDARTRRRMAEYIGRL
ncbi:MAG: aldo/keto reductase [Nitrospinota bacterium]